MESNMWICCITNTVIIQITSYYILPSYSAVQILIKHGHEKSENIFLAFSFLLCNINVSRCLFVDYFQLWYACIKIAYFVKKKSVSDITSILSIMFISHKHDHYLIWKKNRIDDKTDIIKA